MPSPAPTTVALSAALEAADAGRALSRAWNLTGHRPTLVLAFGKSSLEMARAATSLLAKPAIRTIVLAVPDRLAQAGSREGIGAPGRVEILPADHPLPTSRSLQAATIVRDAVSSFATEYGAAGRIIALISGGGSAHLSLPAPGLALEDLALLNALLQRAGGSIHELNTLRKHTEQLKGGLLARLAHPSSVHAFVASDVMGDPLDVIASGPFAPDPTTFADAIAIIERYKLAGQLPAVITHLRAGAAGRHAETLKPAESPANIHHTIITSNASALHAVARSLKQGGYHVARCTQALQSPAAKAVGESLASAAVHAALEPSDGQDSAPVPTHARGTGVPPVSTLPSSIPSARGHRAHIALLWGGEPVVDTRDASPRDSQASSLGGPSQELALAAAITLHGALPALRTAHARISIAAFSTDGIDGPTPAAGAHLTHDQIESLPLDQAREALARHDSHTFLGAQRALLTPGPTGVNVNHLAMILIDR